MNGADTDIQPLLALSSADLQALAKGLRSGRIAAPATAMGLQSVTSPVRAAALARCLAALAAEGMTSVHVARLCDVIAADRASRPSGATLIDLVMTGPAAEGVPVRDTGAVVRQLFGAAQRSVLVVGYAVHGGRRVFKSLAERMSEVSVLNVTLCLDVQRPRGDDSPSADLVKRFGERFVHEQWPIGPLPAVYHDPRSLEVGSPMRSCLHAKCVVVDRATVFVSSANFTTAAQERNIELGVLIRSARHSARIEDHFEGLIERGALRRIELAR